MPRSFVRDMLLDVPAKDFDVATCATPDQVQAVFTRTEKAVGHSGVPHLDTYGAFTTWLMQQHNFTPQQIARVCALHPANFVREFLPANFTRASLKTKCAWSPFEGITFPGRVTHTILCGEVYAL